MIIKKLSLGKAGTIFGIVAVVFTILIHFLTIQERIAKIEGYLLGRKEIKEEKGKLKYPFPEYGIIIKKAEEKK